MNGRRSRSHTKGRTRDDSDIDYDAGNIKSVEKAMQLLGQEVTITRDRETIMNADKVILPGVGAFGDAMGNSDSMDLMK